MDRMSFKSLKSLFILMYSVLLIFTSISTASLLTYTKIASFDFLYNNISTALNLTDAESKCNNVANEVTIKNSGFELGLVGWNIDNEVSIVSENCRSGKYCVRVGNVTETNGESKISQSFVVATGKKLLSFWYKMICPDTIIYDWMTAELIDHTAGTTWNMSRVCETSRTWTLITTSVISGHSYTLSLINNDDNHPNDASNTLFDDISLSPIPLCVGYNSDFFSKYDLQNPTISSSNFYVHATNVGMSFVQLIGWDSAGIDIPGYAPIVLSNSKVSLCAYLCTKTNGCVGAVWQPIQRRCWLKASYGPPTQVVNRNMLIPVGNGGCPSSSIVSGNCISSVKDDLIILCQIMVAWNLYSNELSCLLRVRINYSSRIQFENDRVTRIDFGNLQISGSIPSELSQLTSLAYLFLDSNQLRGTIPFEISILTRLFVLSFSDNSLTGTIPSVLSQLIGLQYLYLAKTLLIGTIPYEVSQLTGLKVLDLSRNQLSGTISSVLSQLTGLQYLYLADNQLTGTIPSELGQLARLNRLYLYTNQLAGTIPSELYQLTGLQYLYLSENQLIGTIPSIVGQLTALQFLYLADNQLTNMIPSELCQLAGLKVLDLAYNLFTGIIPSELSQLIGLNRLYLQTNQLTGTIPSELRKLIGLNGLYLQSNRLTGTIPSVLSQLTGLQYLYLADNQLTGTIPSELSQLIGLQYLFLTLNQLTGTIPSDFSLLTGLNELGLNQNQLTGTISSELSKLTRLGSLLIRDNELTGTIPSVLCQLFRLQYLYLGNNLLTGTIPYEISRLSALKSLDISDNLITGKIPSTLTQLTGLNRLFLHINKLNGTILSEIGRLKTLQYFRLEDNQFTGTIPHELSQLTQLLELSLHVNQLTGTIPHELSQLTSLRVLLISDNELTGTIPREFSQLTQLQYLFLNTNQLTGAIPSLSQNNNLIALMLHSNHFNGSISSQLGLLTKLVYFFVPDNELSGTFPTEICQITGLKFLALYGNKLSGTLPTQLALLTALETLNIDNNLLTVPFPADVAYLIYPSYEKFVPEVMRPVTHNSNSFTGSLPSEIGLMKSLKKIFIETNLFTGSLPSEIGLLRKLQSISMTSNQITGSIPSEFGELKNLTEIRLSNNRLSGSIPSQLGGLQKLTEIHLSSNKLSGTIPGELGFLVLLLNLYLTSNQITGHIPKELSKLTALQQLQLSNNLLTGMIATDFSQLAALQNFDVNTNRLVGPIPSELAKLGFLQYLTFDHNSGINGTVSNEICLIQSLVKITVSIGVSCPTNCTNKCLKLEQTSNNPNDASPSMFPISLRVVSNNSNLLSTGGIIGIVVGTVIFIVTVLFSLYCFIFAKCKSSNSGRAENKSTLEHHGKNMDNVENCSELSSFAKQNRLKIFSWDHFVFDNLLADTVIGEGSFGLVVRSKLLTGNKLNLTMVPVPTMSADEELVIKILKNDQLGDNTELELILREVQIHINTSKKIVNKNCIVKLYGLVGGELSSTFSKMLNVKKAFGIVMHYEAGGSLNSVLYSDVSIAPTSISTVTGTISDSKSSDDISTIPEAIAISKRIELPLVQKFYILHKIAQGLAELHRADIVHGDLKPENVLLSSKDILQAEIRLADFGCANFRDKNAEIGMSSLVRTSHQHGTPIYLSPEQLFNPSSKHSSINAATYAKPSIKTDIYSFAVLSWEILTQQKPYSNISSLTELAVVVHKGIRPDIQLLPTDCPILVKKMIERCWAADRSNRLTALECFTTLRDCYNLLSTIKYDVYLVYRNLKYLQIISKIKNQLLENGFKVASFENVIDAKNKREELNKRVELIKQSKVVLLCLEEDTQKDDECLYELGNNRGFKYSRPVVPLFLEPRKNNFPDNEIRVHCYMGCSDTEVFDVSDFIDNMPSINSVHVEIAIEDSNTLANNTQIGIDPLSIEINRLIDYIRIKLNEDHVRY